MKEIINSVKQIMNYWLMTEYTEQNDFPVFTTEPGKAGDDLRKKGTLPEKYSGKFIIDHVGITDYTDDVFSAVKNNTAADDRFPYISNIRYFAMGRIRRNLIVDYLIGLSEREALYENAYKDKTEIAWFSFSTTDDGTYVSHSFRLSNLLWAITTIRKDRGRRSLSYDLSPKVYEEIVAYFEEKLLKKKYADFIRPLYDEIYHDYVSYLGIPGEISGVCALYRYMEEPNGTEEKPEEEPTALGRSYIAKDLELVLSEISAGQFGQRNPYEKAVLAYIASAVPDTAAGIRKNISAKSPREEMKSFFLDKLDPLRSPLGKWPSRYMPALMQQTAVNLSIDEENPLPVFSVNGPPGSGKTTLLKEIITHYIVKRAELLCEAEEPDMLFKEEKKEQPLGEAAVNYFTLKNDRINDYSIIVTSCNNTAVENITKDLPCQSDLLGGLTPGKEDTETVAEQLRVVSSFFTPEKAADRLMVYVKKDEYEDYPDLYYTHYVRELFDKDDNWGLISAPLGKKANINKYCYKFLKQLFFNSLCRPEERSRHLALFQKRREAFKQQLEKVIDLRRELHGFSIAPEKTEKKSLFSLFAKPSKTMAEYFKEYSEKGEHPSAINEKFMDDYYSLDDGRSDAPSTRAQITDPWFTNAYNREREKLFYLGLMVHKEFVLSSKAIYKNVEAILKIWGSLENEKPIILNDTKEAVFTPIMQSLFLITPVISTTFASMQSLMKYEKQSGAFGLLIVDEAGQAPPEMAIGSLYRCRHAVIVGDPKQVEPVVTTETMMIKEMIVNDTTRRYMNKDISVQQFADSLNPYGTMLDGAWVGCPLVVHRRCIDPMYSIANRLSYDDTMKLQSPSPKPEIEQYFIYSSSGWIDVSGKENGNKDHFVEKQGMIVPDMLRIRLENLSKKSEQLMTEGKEVKENDLKLNLFIISPFTSVKEGIVRLLEESALWKKYPSLKKWSEENIGTVHTFQGKGTDEVIFLLGCDQNSMGAVRWVNKNIVNVAATRAKFRFYVIGDRKLWRNCSAIDKIDDLLGKIDSAEFEKKESVQASLQTQTVKKSTAFICPNCGAPVRHGKNGYFCPNTNLKKCDMEFHWLYGYRLSDEEVLKLLSGKELQYDQNGKKMIALPKCKMNEYKGKTRHIWENIFG